MKYFFKLFTCFPAFFFYWKTNHRRRFPDAGSQQHLHQDYQHTLHHHRNHPLDLYLLDHPDCVYPLPINRNHPKCQQTRKYSIILLLNRLQFTLKDVTDPESDNKKLKQ